MTRIHLENLEESLKLLKLKNFRLKESQPQQRDAMLGVEVMDLTLQIIERFNLKSYDHGIKYKSHKTDFFIADVEQIIKGIKNNTLYLV